ncbi:tripartite tricarboxylate transporter permease [Pseudomonas sp. NFACC39-1]|uniref:tripartite tricarboxylate transporter permease n=1 Tax=Pseudomonas sp. NFACC39-1 TaxID=1566195 RepID=UPI0008CA0DDB|nr:tripartite tricarboxylate transporter permease [Pseudomonas sp. NFACC39-1]SEO02369.1 putative tricarboxylic transport membrane protein [Pseudomonas sp. NFACC39-1]
MFDNLLIGFLAFADPLVLVGLIVGALLGYMIGALPGLGPSLGVALLIPFTYSLDPLVSIVTLVSLYAAAEYGGAISAILINSPGTAAAVATSWDGFPLTQQGKAGVALTISIVSSGIGIFISAVLLFLTAVPLSEFALNFGPTAYFALALVGLSLVSTLSNGAPVKGAIAMAIGLALATVGLDSQTGTPRFSPNPEFFEGFPLVPVLLGLFALSEVIFMVEAGPSAKTKSHPVNSILAVPLKTFGKLKFNLLRSSIIGYVIGVVPGAGASIASFVSYAVAKKVSKTPNEFGKGSLEGIAAAESANNSAVSGALAPLFALGIPGSPTTAIMIGALMIHGIQPGPLLFTTNPEIPYTVIAALWMSVPVMIFIGLAGARYWAKVADIPRPAIAAAVSVICLMGAYASENSMFPVYVTLAFGIVGYVLRKLDIPLAPIILALVLGEMLETNFRRALVISNGEYDVFYSSPLTLVLLAVAVLSFATPAVRFLRDKFSRGRLV